MERDDFTPPADCLYPLACLGKGCVVASIINHEINYHNSLGNSDLRYAINIYCSNPEAVKARERGRKILNGE